MTSSELATRFSNYADALVAFAVLNCVGFMSVIADEDSRGAIVEAPTVAFLLSLLLATCFYTILALVFRRAELQLCDEAGEPETEKVVRYQRYFQAARIAVIWVSNGISALVFLAIR